jgi:hypothetical protein
LIPYKSKSGKPSGVIAYKIGTDYIKVQFTNFEIYTYTYQTAGKETIETMKQLALASEGLSTFVARNKPGYL